MSFDIIGARSYGTGSLGDVTNPSSPINSYARVTATANKTITIAGDDLSAFTAGTEILLHIAGTKSASTAASKLGLYKLAKIMSVADDVLTLSVKPLNVSTSDYFYQAITVPHYKTLTLSGTISPPAFDETKGYGGVLVFKCSRKLTMSGKINLVDKGLLTETYRPLLNQEQGGTLDTDTYSGYENYETNKHFVLNRGDGAAMIIAKQIDFDDSARIGNPNLKGVQRCRGAEDSLGRATEMTNIGGSTILIAAEAINDFVPAIISKYRSKTLETGKGLCRAYIATESSLPFDEGLYAYDIINTPRRIYKDICFDGTFGSGALGNAKRATAQQNNYARITAIKSNGYEFVLTNITADGIATFERGGLVMIHASYKEGSSKRAHVGRFFLSEIAGIKNTTAGVLNSITLKHSVNELGLSNFDPDHYDMQAIAIPQYKNYYQGDGRPATYNTATPKYEGGRGGIFAIAVSDTCDLRGGRIGVGGKGGSKYTLDYVSNANMKNRLPIGEGNGSIFILAKALKVDENTRLGVASGGDSAWTNGADFGGAYSTSILTRNLPNDGGYQGKRLTSGDSQRIKYYGYGGSGSQGGKQKNGHNGGFCSNPTDGGLLQGASIFIVAQKIEDFSLHCLMTGGHSGSLYGYPSKEKISLSEGKMGGCGYGGGGLGITGRYTYVGGQGGVHGGGGGSSDPDNDYWSSGGGSSGFCCIYCNEVTNQSTQNMLFD